MIAKKCAYCDRETDFVAHSDYLCLYCGDKILSMKPEQLLEYARRSAKAVRILKEVGKWFGRGDPPEELLEMLKEVDT